MRSTRSHQAMHNLALGWRDAGRLADAVLLMRQALNGYEAKLGAGHDALLRPLTDLGELLTQSRAFTEAEPLLLRAWEGYQSRATQRPSTSRKQARDQAVRRLVQLYETWGKPDDASKWREKAR